MTLINISQEKEFIRIMLQDNQNTTQLDVRLTRSQTRQLRDMLNSEELCD